MALTALEQLRMLIAERIPDGGSEDDTMFSDEELQVMLDEAGSNVRAAAWLGWTAKSGEYANLVTQSEGNSARNNSDLAAAAMKMADRYAADAAASGLTAVQRMRIGSISRPGGSI